MRRRKCSAKSIDLREGQTRMCMGIRPSLTQGRHGQIRGKKEKTKKKIRLKSNKNPERTNG